MRMNKVEMLLFRFHQHLLQDRGLNQKSWRIPQASDSMYGCFNVWLCLRQYLLTERNDNIR